MKKNLFTGVGTALATPFCGYNAGFIAWGSLLNNAIEAQITAGVNFLVPCGTTGESPTLSHEEHDQVITRVVEQVNGRVPVLAGTGSNNTAEAVRLTKMAKSVGADGVLVVSPYYNKPTQSGIADYYWRIAEAELPIVLYDIPGRCGGQGVSAQTILDLAHAGVICGLKWASGNFDQLQDVLIGRPENFTVLSGDDNLTFTAMCLGADGVISVLSNILPGEMVRLVDSLRNHDWKKARICHYGLLKIMRAMSLETNPIPVKTALHLLKPQVFAASFRSPMCEMEEANKEKLKKVLQDYGLL